MADDFMQLGLPALEVSTRALSLPDYSIEQAFATVQAPPASNQLQKPFNFDDLMLPSHHPDPDYWLNSGGGWGGRLST